jgi:hypothetical protein
MAYMKIKHIHKTKRKEIREEEKKEREYKEGKIL